MHIELFDVPTNVAKHCNRLRLDQRTLWNPSPR